MPKNHYIVVGAGLAGAVLARQLADHLDCGVTIFEAKEHIAGNCHTERDGNTGVMVHKYGPHIFNTNNQAIWNYANRFATFRPFVNRVKATIDKGVFSFPINLHTINQFFGKTFTPAEARDFINSRTDHTISEPVNFEQQALKLVGRELYEAFFYSYTKKQWGCEPRELPASLLKRLPVRFNYDDSYYDKAFQGIPEEGYTEMVRNILTHENISVSLRTPFSAGSNETRTHLFYTGSLDAYFEFKLGRLGYRTVTFERREAAGDFQGCAVINYPGAEVPYTRIHEHKHFAPRERHQKTVYFKEFSKETEPHDLPYYPKRLGSDLSLLEKYVSLAEAQKNISFLGRLGTYRYLNMDEVIAESLDFAATFIRCLTNNQPPPVFSHSTQMVLPPADNGSI